MAIWYADTSAVVKLVVTEVESSALERWLLTEQWVISDLHRTEVTRAARRVGPNAFALAEQLLADAKVVSVTERIFDAAALIDPPSLRSLDALHLAAALTLGPDLAGIVAYDRRLLAAATDLGIPVASPA